LGTVGEPTELTLEERDLDTRAVSSLRAPVEGCEDCHRRLESADHVRRRDAHLRWLLEAGDAHDAASRLDQKS
jgi:hypothetical protein